jgi:phospholipid/cholesterol/gamma-HCH transport system substrate-binding protein
MIARLSRGVLAAIAAVVVIALLVLVVTVVFKGPNQKTATAYFPVAVHVYAGSDVDVLGVPVGTVKSVTPQGTQVKVVISYDASRKIPANVSAVILDPTLVADRVVQLAPVYSGHGPVLKDNAVIPLAHNEVPVELDQLNRNLYTLTQALGPQGANKNGALSRAIAVGDANLHGQGAKANSTITHLSELVQTLNDNRGSLVATVNHLESFTSTLAAHDAQTRSFAGELSTVSAELDRERKDFAAALHNLGFSLGQVATFIHHNRSALSSDVRGLATVSTILSRERVLLGHMADMGAVGISNYPHMYTPSQRTYNARFNFSGAQQTPVIFLCQLVHSYSGVSAKKCLKTLAALKGVTIPSGPPGQAKP